MIRRGGKKCVQMKWVFTREKEGVCVCVKSIKETLMKI